MPGRTAAAPLLRSWHALNTPAQELRLHATLENGQCFGWHRQPGDDRVWVGVLGERLLALRETESDCLFRCLSRRDAGATRAPDDDADEMRSELREYFQLDTPLVPLYDQWSRADTRMATVAGVLPGMRVLRQEPVECLFSFICSSNNNIARIGGMLQSLRKAYGEPLPAPAAVPSLSAAAAADAEGEEGADGAADGSAADGGSIGAPFEPVGLGYKGETFGEFYTFPTTEALAAASEADLRALGLGYRAAYVRQTAATLLERGSSWLPSLRQTADPDAVRASLCELSGVGPKVADCAALFSLDQSAAIPVDTHVWDIACRDLDPELTQCGSLTPKVYGRVGSLFRGRYGSHAGWAHSVLFAAELPLFRHRLPEGTQAEMTAFREASKAARAQEKADRADAKARGEVYKRPAPSASVTTADGAAASADASGSDAEGGGGGGAETPVTGRKEPKAKKKKKTAPQDVD